MEVTKREKQAAVVPDFDIDTYMKVQQDSIVYYFPTILRCHKIGV